MPDIAPAPSASIASARGAALTAGQRVGLFALSATSILCLLVEFYGLASMRLFTLIVYLPALLLLLAWAAGDYLRGNGRVVFRAVVVGSVAGLLAAVAYDLFRLPFVFARPWGISGLVPALPLFKVFPQFGAMILGLERGENPLPLSAHLLGWVYHFSNGMSFGVMYLAMVGSPARRHWAWAILLAVALELGMLLTPYPGFFGISVGATLITVTLAAHLIFGVALGLLLRGAYRRYEAAAVAV